MSLSSLADAFAPFIREIQSTRYAELASSAIVIYDHLITLDQEIDLIWKASWTPGKVLFLTNRYYVLASVIFNNYEQFSSPHISPTRCTCLRIKEILQNQSHIARCLFRGISCVKWFRWQGTTGLLVSTIAEIILQLRLYALYHLNRRVLVLMCGAFLVSAGTAAVIMGMVLARISGASPPRVLSAPFQRQPAHSGLIPGLPFCIPVNVPSWFYTFWIPTLGFESLLCALALFRAFKDFRSRTSLFQSGRHIVKILIRDSVIYYLIMFATYFTNLVIFLTGNVGVLESGIGFAVTMSCVMGSRLCLNIRDVHHELEVSTASQQQQQQHLTQPSFVSGGRSAYGTASRGTNIVVSSTYALTEFELVELRNLRAQGKV
ncbi:hypothetical protein GLOTRDRAFT_133959 [Gloeophyllum trabeum ATCC 11539]|uniref:DUF6533 domain-containing protein n=1 Tax=Gloeophyllum trabeum (strain ATCC 11539 / FP-39264 / Madison 617) TaxID=670483 RepID=S7R7R8_GLOTA|nr:uncharacterized protein GLOTRDRAFT_133959 [Gloeophyllum trabeum ATCC 11539]EPQ50405.1 hypothetical protein GLOTRDRAFT_133959 [Gloeophyllum trabeum ATCC 11539]